MKKTKKILISRELHEMWTIRSGTSANHLCQTCHAECMFTTLDSAVVLSGLSTREIISGIQAGAVHTLDAASGQMLICASSLGTYTARPQ